MITNEPVEYVLNSFPFLRSPEGIMEEFKAKRGKANLKYLTMRIKRQQEKIKGNHNN